MASHSSIHPRQKDESSFLTRGPAIQSHPPKIVNRKSKTPDVQGARGRFKIKVECWSGTTRPLQPRQPGSTPGHFATNSYIILVTEDS